MAQLLIKSDQRRRRALVPIVPRKNFPQSKNVFRLSKSHLNLSRDNTLPSPPPYRRSTCVPLRRSPPANRSLQISKSKRRTHSAQLMRRGVPKSSFLSQAVARKIKISRLNNSTMLSRRSKRVKKRGKNKARIALDFLKRYRCSASEFLLMFDEDMREEAEEEIYHQPTPPRSRQMCELKDIVPYLLNESPKARRQHNLVSSIASRIKTFWLGSRFNWDIEPKISYQYLQLKSGAVSNKDCELSRFPNDPITAPITSQLTENCVVDLLCNQGRKVSWVLWMRKKNSVKFLGHIPDRVWQIPFANEVTGMTYDLKRRLLWIFGNRRQIAFHVNTDPGYLSIAYSLCHPLGNMVMKYDQEHDYLVGTFGSLRVTLRQKDC